MTLVPFYFAGETLLTYVSHELAVNALSDTTGNIYSLITNLYGFSNKHIVSSLREMDILSKIQIVEAIIKEIPENKFKNDSSLYIALQQLHNIVEEIENQLEDMNMIMKKHSEKWFSSWRASDFNLPGLQSNYKIMEKRLDMFIKLLDIDITKKIRINKKLKLGN